MLKGSSRLAEAARFIRQDEFLDALYRVWPDGRCKPPKKLALAISGGVDSMALAVMCKKYITRPSELQLEAFVVDHKLRRSSSKEADAIKNTCEVTLGIPTTILTLPTNKPHMTNSNIETTVRTLRYQALGKACWKSKTSKLLLGHHEDDQYESILQRLSTSHTRGLKAMRPLTNLPESFGIYGLHGSGTPQPTPLPRRGPTGVYAIEGGNITLGRPLLQFPKERLIATCKEFNVPWVEDESNKDAKLTSRNAIRHIIQNYALPAALRKDSLLHLCSSKRQNFEQMEARTEELFNQRELALDVRTGVLITSQRQPALPSASPNQFLGSKENTDSTGIPLSLRLASLVSPDPTLDMSSFNTAATESTNFTAGHVHFMKVNSPFSKWILSREPYNPRDKHINCIHMPFPPSKERIPSREAFKLWDGRFWIRLHNPSEKTFLVRPLCEEDMTAVRSLLKGREMVLYSAIPPAPEIDDLIGHSYEWSSHAPADFDRILGQVAKGRIRFTLPVIAEVDATTGQSHVCALPTLGLRLGREGLWREGFQGLRWEVRYKEINLGNLKMENCIVGCGSQGGV